MSVTFLSIEEVKVTALQLQERFEGVTAEAEDEISEHEAQDRMFLSKFRKYLQFLPVARRAPHNMFFHESEKAIVAAKNTWKILAVLCRYVDFRNYEIMRQIIIRFCAAPLQERMQKYCERLEGFEKATTVDVYLTAIPEETDKELENAFSKMAVKIDKPASQCTLYEVRKLNEELIKGSSLPSHSVYISSVTNKCVEVVVRFPSSAVGWVLAAMTPNFIHTHHLTEVAVDGEKLTHYESGRDKLVCRYCGVLVHGNAFSTHLMFLTT